MVSNLPDDVIEYVAHNIDNNVRELEGAMVSLLAQSTLNRKEIDLEPGQANAEELYQKFFERDFDGIYPKPGLRIF